MILESGQRFSEKSRLNNKLKRDGALDADLGGILQPLQRLERFFPRGQFCENAALRSIKRAFDQWRRPIPPKCAD
jgi:hypothetical protein